MSLRLMLAYLFLVMLSCNTSTEKRGETVKAIDGPIFQLTDQNKTGINFENEIIENESFNHFMWGLVYSGAGVGAGDINNDGLMDLFFSGNHVNDVLYLNKGNLKFEDISKSAGINHPGWSTGVTFADVNQDGFDDIYVCRNSFSMDENTRRNLLYINNGDNTFTEQAKAFGVDDGGFSIQATFFDLDKDGDLDMYLGNQPPDPRVAKINKLQPGTQKEKYSDKLFRNTGRGKFIDITKGAGLSNYGFALNIMASDLNEDGWTDLYVTNDYITPDFLYINNGDLTFRNEINKSIKHISTFAMGSDVGDINNDGLPDIAVVDMAGKDHIRSKTNMGSMRPAEFWKNVDEGNHYQYMFNTLQLNNGNESFSDVAQLAGISKTDWSWSILLADFDNDTDKDIIITNGIKRDIRNNDFRNEITAKTQAGQSQFQMLDLVNMVPSNPIANFIYENEGHLSFKDVTKEWGGYHPGFSQGMAMADFDLDGDIDYVISNTGSVASFYENKQGNKNNFLRVKLKGTKGNPNALNAKVEIIVGAEKQVVELTASRGFMSASEPIAHFGLADNQAVDELRVHWPNDKWTILKNPSINQLIALDIKDATSNAPVKKSSSKLFADIGNIVGLNYKHQENDYDDFTREILLPHKQSQNGPYLCKGDVNGDGLDDFFVGGAAGYSGTLYLQNSNGGFQASTSAPWNGDKAQEDLGCLFLDIDNDKDLDLYVVSGGSEFEANSPKHQDRLYKNNGKGNFSKAVAAIPAFNESGQCVAAGDFDGDDDLDLFVGGRLVPGQYPRAANSHLLVNEKGTFKDITMTAAPAFKGLGMVTDAIFNDYDSDGDQDLIIVGEWMKVEVFRNTDNKFESVSDALGLADSQGWWWSIEGGDFDKDGDMDFLVGNLGKNAKFKASSEKPFMVYGSDFDHNGTNDVVLCNYYGDKVVPVRGRECSSEQMPFVAEKFPTFDGFAKASVENIIGEEELKAAVKFEVKTFKSAVLLNNGGKFELRALPMEVQTAPIRDWAVADFNKDGHLDALGVGNLYSTEVETARYDAGIGICLLGDGQGNFKYSPVTESGFFAPYDARNMAVLNGANKPIIVIANNQEALQFYNANLSLAQ